MNPNFESPFDSEPNFFKTTFLTEGGLLIKTDGHTSGAMHKQHTYIRREDTGQLNKNGHPIYRYIYLVNGKEISSNNEPKDIKKEKNGMKTNITEGTVLHNGKVVKVISFYSDGHTDMAKIKYEGSDNIEKVKKSSLTYKNKNEVNLKEKK